jgi:uncharacterized protein with FMN-binding domain
LRSSSAPVALVAGLAIAGCGQQKLAPSNTPAAVSTPRATATATATAAPSRSSSGTFTGSDVLTQFGDVQVAITLAHGKITDVRALKLPSDRPRSQYISQTVEPLLRNEVINAQSANINLISGASYTSDAWANSVHAALVKAGL